MSTLESTLELLREQFPKCFARSPQPPQPLKIGIHKDVHAALAGVVSKSALRKALMAYVNAPAYREQLKPGAARIDLAGEPAGVVTPEQVPPPLKSEVKLGAYSSASGTASSPKRLSLADLKAGGAARRTRSTSDCA